MFKDVNSVLYWAYTTATEPIVHISSANRMQEQPSRGVQNQLLLGLSVQERHQQAAEILGMVARLPDPATAAYVGAAFGHRTRDEDLKMLVYRCCAALGLDLTASAALQQILKIYFDDGKVGYRTVRRILGCRNQYALMVQSCMYDVLEVTHDRAMADLQEIFSEHGLLRDRACC